MVKSSNRACVLCQKRRNEGNGKPGKSKRFVAPGGLRLKSHNDTTMMSLLRRSSSSRSLSTRLEPSFFETAHEYLSSFRWKAANVLTESLSPAQRDLLWEKLHIQPKQEQQEDEIQPTIAEAVAAARAQEASRHQARWEEQKDELFRQAQEAAQARIQTDLAIQQQRQIRFQQWQQELKQQQQEELTQEEEEHPILGRVLANLGSKRIHLTTATALATIPVWRKQRIYRHQRAKDMAKDVALDMSWETSWDMC